MVEFSADVSPIVAKLTEGFSFAYLKELFIMTLLIIAHGGNPGDDNDSTEEETKADTPHTEDSLKASESKGNKTDAVVIESPTDDSQRPEEMKKDHSKLLEKLKAQDEVVIPEYLQNNILLKVLRKQSKALLLEMDNTDVEQWKSGGLGYSTFQGSRRAIQRPIPSFMNAVRFG